MNRRIAIPGALTALVLSFIVLTLPAGAASLAQATPQATVDVCNPKPPVPGIVNSNLAVLETANDQLTALIYIKQTDVINVLGRTANGFWYEVQSNAGVIGWVHASGVTVDPKLIAKLAIVDGQVSVVQPTAEATDEATQAATEQADTCDHPIGVVTGTLLALKEKPDTTSKDVGATVRQTEQVTVLSFNGSGTWYKIRNKDGVEGWVGYAYVAVTPASKLALIPHDYSFVEVTVTPTGQ